MPTDDPVGAALERYALALEAANAGTWSWDRRTGEVYWDPALEALNGLEEGTFGGRFEDWIERVHPDDREDVIATLDRALKSRHLHHVVYRSVHPDGTIRWVEGRGKLLFDDQGQITGLVGVCQDVTERQEIEAERSRLLQAEQGARDRLEFLAEASRLLARSLDVDETLQELAQLTVPRLGDFCAIQLEQQGEPTTVALAHSDPAALDYIRRIRSRYGSILGQATSASSAKAVLFPEITDGMLEAVAEDDEHLEGLRGLELSSAIVAPLRARNERIGTLGIVHTYSARRHSEEDRTLVEDLAGRAAIAIDNARLFSERSRVAESLQRALLPPALPELPGVELAAHYDTAEGIDIGGDFYDVLGVGEGWTMVIGDVCGKGVEAASLTALARHTVRAAALHEPEPVHILQVLNDALLEREAADSFCTAVCGFVTLEEGGARLTLATGGHPDPLVLRADGSLAPAGCSGMLIGAFPAPEVEVVTVTLAPGDLVFFYTDGLSEARCGDELFGSERVRSALQTVVGTSAEAVLKHVHAAVEDFQSEQRDDMAMLALRLLP